VELRTGLERTVAWFRENRDRLEPMLTPTAELVFAGGAV
jgi:hypothetical protein